MRTFASCVVVFALLANVIALHKIELMRKNKNMFLRPSYMTRIEGSHNANVYLYGALNVTFEYYAAIGLGSDKQVFAVQVDTGSASLAVPAAGCSQYTLSGQPTDQECAHADAFYDESDSTDSSDVECDSSLCAQCTNDNICEFELAYGDGSFLLGTLVKDLVTMGSLSTEAIFGQIKQESTNFASTDTDGILGVAYHALDTMDGDDVFGKFVDAGLTENSFSMCLGFFGGIFVFGGMDSTYNAGPVVYTPVTMETYYVVEMLDLLVDGQSINVPPIVYNENNTIVDSGTTLLLIPPDAFGPLVTKLQNYCPPSISSLCACESVQSCLFYGGYCYNIPQNVVSQFPNISIVLQNTGPLNLTAEQYFLNAEGGYCFGISEVEGLGTILGDVFMQAFNVHFDRANKQVGFAPVANCGAPELNIVKTAGDEQNVDYKFMLKNPLSVTVTYSNGLPAVGMIVSFTATSGNFDFDDDGVTVTDGNGLATINGKAQSVGTISIEASLKGFNGNPISFKIHSKGGRFVGIIVGCIIAALVLTTIFVVARVLIRRRHHHRHGHGITKAYEEETLIPK